MKCFAFRGGRSPPAEQERPATDLPGKGSGPCRPGPQNVAESPFLPLRFHLYLCSGFLPALLPPGAGRSEAFCRAARAGSQAGSASLPWLPGWLDRYRVVAVHHRQPGRSSLDLLVTLCPACHAVVERTQVLFCDVPELLRVLWRELHPAASEQMASSPHEYFGTGPLGRWRAGDPRPAAGDGPGQRDLAALQAQLRESLRGGGKVPGRWQPTSHSRDFVPLPGAAAGTGAFPPTINVQLSVIRKLVEAQRHGIIDSETPRPRSPISPTSASRERARATG
jgi:hypothetical protein